MPLDKIAVLVVEDEPLVRLVIVTNLEDEGFFVSEAANAAEALMVLAIDPDVHAVFTDIDMPGDSNGLDLALIVRDRWPSIKIIVTSGDRRFLDNSPPAGERFIPKPYESRHVIASIYELISSA